MQADERCPEAGRDLLGVESGELAAVGAAQGAVGRPRVGGIGEPGEAERAQGADAVGPEREPGADRLQLLRALEHGHLEPGVAQRDRGREAADAAARDDGAAAHHAGCSPSAQASAAGQGP